MYRAVFAAVAAIMTFGTAYQEDINPLRQSLPDPRGPVNTAPENPQIAGVENLINTLQATLDAQGRRNEDLKETFAKLQNTVSTFEGAVGSIEGLNQRVESVALVATQAIDNDAALAARVEALEKTVQELKDELQKQKDAQQTAASQAPPSPAPATGAQPQGYYPAASSAPAAGNYPQQPATASGGSNGSYAQRASSVSGGSTGNYPANYGVAASGGSTGSYPASYGVAAGGGSTGSYTQRTVATGGGCTGSYAASPAVFYPVAETMLCTDAAGNQVACYDAYGNQVPCNQAAYTTSTGGLYTSSAAPARPSTA